MNNVPESLNVLWRTQEILHCRKEREYQGSVGRWWKVMSDLEETHKSCPRRWPRDREVWPGLGCILLGCPDSSQALPSNQPELMVPTPEDSQNLELKHPSLTHVYFKVTVLHDISKMGTPVLCQSLLPSNDRNLQCSCQSPSTAHSGKGHALLFGKLAIWKHVCRGSPTKGLCCVSGGRAFLNRTASSSGRGWVEIMYKQEIKQASCTLARRQGFSNPTFGGGLGYQWPLHSHPLWGKCTSPGSCLSQNFSVPGVGSLSLLSDYRSPCRERDTQWSCGVEVVSHLFSALISF